MERYRRALERLRAEREPDEASRERLERRLKARRLPDEAWSAGLLRALPEPEDGATERVGARFGEAVRARRAGRGMIRRGRQEPYSDDMVFLGFLTLSHAAGALLMLVVFNAEPGQIKGLQEIPDRFTELVLKPAPAEAPALADAEVAINEDLEVVKKEEKAEAIPAEQADAEPAREVSEAQRQEQARQEVLQDSSLLMALLGTTGENNSGDRVADLFAEGDLGGQNLDEALANVNGAEIASSADVGVRGAQGGGEGSADIGDLAKASTGGAGVGAGVQARVEGIVSGGAADIVGAGDADGIQSVVRRYRGQIKYCYDARLKENPSIQGRIDIQFSIARGRVLSASVLGNTTGDAALGDCIARKVQGWRFDSAEEAEVVYPFILAL